MTKRKKQISCHEKGSGRSSSGHIINKTNFDIINGLTDENRFCERMLRSIDAGDDNDDNMNELIVLSTVMI
eukprot:scaffold148833_cov41-Prasinocladus_malaysianus.AAC.1